PTAGTCTGSLQVSSDDFSSCIGVAVISMAPGNASVGLRFQQVLQYSTTYKIRVTTAAESASSVALSSAFTQSTGFTTESSASGKADYSLASGGTLVASGANATVRSLALRADNHIIVVGDFTSIGHVPRNRIAVLMPDGTVDPAFNPGAGANNAIYAVALQTDGRIVVGGIFTDYNGTTRNRLARIMPDGALDTTFDPSGGPNSTVNDIKIQADGKLVIGGWFGNYNGTGRNRIARANTDGSLDGSFNPGAGASDTVNSIAIQTDGKIVIAGNFTSYNGTARNRIARLETDGSLDTSFNPGSGANAAVHSIALQSDGKIVLGGNFTNYAGTSRNYIARANADGSNDASFAPSSGANNSVLALKIQSDGKIIAAGTFTVYNGANHGRIVRTNTDGSLDASFASMPGAETQSVLALALQSDGKVIFAGDFARYNGKNAIRIARSNTDGTADAGFDSGGHNNTVNAIALQSDGKILTAGLFTNFAGTLRGRVVRTLSDGSLDTSFDPLAGANNTILAMAVQSDGKILIGGSFTNYNGTGRNRLARINTDGSLDFSFTPGAGANNTVHSIAIQSDGKIVIGGAFGTYEAMARNRIARVNINGSLDTLFVPVSGADGIIHAIAIQSDGNIVIGGAFTTYDGVARNRIARVTSLGVLDTTFDPGAGANGDVRSIAIQPDGKILIAGFFTEYNGTTRNRIARLNTDGSLDTTFNPAAGADNSITALALQSDGKMVIAGDFLNYAGVGRNRLARVNSDGSLDSSLTPGLGFNSGINALALQIDGKILVGGNFTSYNNALWPYLVRILP
ncbi:MAG: delta-60 repeat domain-containing protein, partial [Turneriella sp.]|nr:delta-60 repeat domain-containing protein [Turneriella sp.]